MGLMRMTSESGSLLLHERESRCTCVLTSEESTAEVQYLLGTLTIRVGVLLLQHCMHQARSLEHYRWAIFVAAYSRLALLADYFDESHRILAISCD